MEVIAENVAFQVFGAEGSGSTAEARARTSNRMFVRSQDHLAVYREGDSGHRLSAVEALTAYGFEKLVEAVEFGSAILPPSTEEPAATLFDRRNALGLTTQTVADRAGLRESDVQQAENTTARSPIATLEKIATTLGLDERLIAAQAGSGGDARLAARLRTLSTERLSFSQNVVGTFAEAAWVIRTQIRLADDLWGHSEPLFEPDANYGSSEYPAWRHGYFLATKARQILHLDSQPISSLRELCGKLRIPFMLATLPKQFAGATIESGSGRGILLNALNQNVWIRRATLAHELGHMFWDPSDRLKAVHVDEYDAISNSPSHEKDFVEARANAFAIEFLAPAKGMEDVFHKESDATAGLRSIMDVYGISFTAARNHIWNTVGKGVEFRLRSDFDVNASAHWLGTESYTDDWFPLKTTSQLRRGEFAGVVVAAERSRLISVDTAAAYLQCEPAEYETAASQVLELFPTVQPAQGSLNRS
jgi:Zn-dependent peptidase ImmA (M78 family)/transcriptional regulator with XRE-family HTH domain